MWQRPVYHWGGWISERPRTRRTLVHFVNFRELLPDSSILTTDRTTTNSDITVTKPHENSFKGIFNMNSTESEISTLEIVTRWFWVICAPVIFIGGVPGNVIAMWIFHKLTSSSSRVHLFVLSVTDTAVLFTNLGRLWLKYTFDLDVRNYFEAGCKIHELLAYTFMDFSGWILVSLACERCLHVYRPFRFKQWCTARKAVIKLAVLFVFICGVNAHLLMTYGLVANEGNQTECDVILENVRHYDVKIFPWIDLTVVSVLPFAIMLTCSVLITRNLRNSGLVFVPELNIVRIKEHNQSGMTNVDRYSSETRLLITLAMLYVFLTLPFAVTNPIDGYLPPLCAVCKARWRLAWTVTYLVQFCNYAVNTVFYRLRDKRFNREFLKMLRRLPFRWVQTGTVLPLQ